MTEAIEILGGTLLHFVWQGLAVGLLAAVVLAAMRRCSANARYLTAVAALSLMAVLPVVTFLLLRETPASPVVSPMMAWKSFVEVPDEASESGLTTVERIGVDFENPPPPGAIPIRWESDSKPDETTLSNAEPLATRRWSWQPIIPWIVSSWLAGVALLSLRLLFGWLSVQRLRRRATQPANENWQALLIRLAERLKVTRPVQLVESALIEVPAVIGWLRPVILLPASAMTGLTTEQLEALLAHELAHVRRHDYLVNLLQTIVETLLFYHPAVWWVSHRIRIEREHCCDDLAVQVCGNGVEYARALVAMEELRAPSLGIAMSARGGSLLSRVARLLGPTDEQRRPVGWIAGLFALLLLTVAGALGAGLLTPPEKPTEGLPNDTKPTATKSNDTNEKTPDPTEQRAPTANRNSVQRSLRNRISLHFENTPLPEAIEQIGREAKLAVQLDIDALEKEGIGADDTPVSVRVDGISTASALQLILQPLQLGYLIENETLVVTSIVRVLKTSVEEQYDLGKVLTDEAKMGLLRDAIHTFVEPKEWDVAGGPGTIRFSASREEFIVRHVPSIRFKVHRFLRYFLSHETSPEMQRLRELLSQSFTLELGEVTLLHAVGKIATAADANVVLDKSGLLTAGVRSNHRVILNHKDAPLGDILDGLCKPLKLRFRIRNEIIQITDEETAKGEFVAILYPVNMPVDDLTNLIQKSIRPESWKVAGGKGTIEPHRPTNSLIIRQHEDVHDEIEQLLVTRNAVRSILEKADSPVSLLAEVVWVNRDKGLVWISLGGSDGVACRMRFQVREKDPPSFGNQPQAVKGKIEVIRIIDAKTAEARVVEEQINCPVSKGDVVVQLVETTQPNAESVEEQRKLPPPKGEFYDSTRPVRPVRESGAVSGAIHGNRKEPDRKMLGRFVGRVRLKTEKSLPDLEKIEVPAGKVLDESLVFSKDGGLANVFVYLWKPKFQIEPATEAELAKPFVLIAEGGKFWPHAALVRVGRPVVFENGAAEPMNFHTHPVRNNPSNVMVAPQDRFKAPALDKTENIPFGVKCDIKPWMLAHLLPLDHPFTAITDDDGRFTINGLPGGEHEFRVWHERVGWLEKSLKITIKPGEDAKSELEYAPDRLKLTEAEVLGWGNRQIDSIRIPRLQVPQPAVPKKDDDAKTNDALGAGLPTPPLPPTEGLPNNAPSTETKSTGQKVETSGPAERQGQETRAERSAAVAKAEYEKILESNRRVPGSVSNTEVERARLNYEKALLAEVRLAIERGIAFLKAQQQENGTWQGQPVDGVTALCAAALLQAGVKADDPVMQKALAQLRNVPPTLSYTVALQTMVFCSASPKEDAELIRRNVTWLEQAQVSEGKSRGAWSYAQANGGRGDGSCSRFAVLGLDAAKNAGFEVKEETWRRVSDYWLTNQKDNGGWGYSPEAQATLSMTLAGIAGLATANRHLPRDEQSKVREAAIRKPTEYVEKSTLGLPKAMFVFYVLQSLERAGHLSSIEKFGSLDWKADATKRLLEAQQPNGSWKGPNAPVAENEFIATGLALLALTGRPEPKPGAGRGSPALKPTEGLPDQSGDLKGDKPKDGDQPSDAVGVSDRSNQTEAADALMRWREATEDLTGFEAEIDRWEYDDVFKVLKRGTGNYRWQGADKWRLELRAPKVQQNQFEEKKHWQTGQLSSFRIQAIEPETWSRTGQVVTYEDGKLADDSPFKRRSFRLRDDLPRPTGFWETFAAGIARISKNPVFLMPPTKDSPHDIRITGRDVNQVWLELKPRGDERADYQLLTVILDQQTSLPRAVRRIDPAGTQEIATAFRSPHIEKRQDRVPK